MTPEDDTPKSSDTPEEIKDELKDSRQEALDLDEESESERVPAYNWAKLTSVGAVVLLVLIGGWRMSVIDFSVVPKANKKMSIVQRNDSWVAENKEETQQCSLDKKLFYEKKYEYTYLPQLEDHSVAPSKNDVEIVFNEEPKAVIVEAEKQTLESPVVVEQPKKVEDVVILDKAEPELSLDLDSGSDVQIIAEDPLDAEFNQLMAGVSPELETIKENVPVAVVQPQKKEEEPVSLVLDEQEKADDVVVVLDDKVDIDLAKEEPLVSEVVQPGVNEKKTLYAALRCFQNKDCLVVKNEVKREPLNLALAEEEQESLMPLALDEKPQVDIARSEPEVVAEEKGQEYDPESFWTVTKKSPKKVDYESVWKKEASPAKVEKVELAKVELPKVKQKVQAPEVLEVMERIDGVVKKPKRSFEVIDFINSSHVASIIPNGRQSRMVLEGRLFRMGAVVNRNLMVRWAGIDEAKKRLYFTDQHGLKYSKRY